MRRKSRHPSIETPSHGGLASRWLRVQSPSWKAPNFRRILDCLGRRANGRKTRRQGSLQPRVARSNSSPSSSLLTPLTSYSRPPKQSQKWTGFDRPQSYSVSGGLVCDDEKTVGPTRHPAPHMEIPTSIWSLLAVDLSSTVARLRSEPQNGESGRNRVPVGLPDTWRSGEGPQRKFQKWRLESGELSI